MEALADIFQQLWRIPSGKDIANFHIILTDNRGAAPEVSTATRRRSPSRSLFLSFPTIFLKCAAADNDEGGEVKARFGAFHHSVIRISVLISQWVRRDELYG